MGISFSGLASGMDTQGIVRDLMRVERTRVERVEKEKTRFEWKRDAWSDLNKELFGFYKKELFDFKSAGTYRSKKLNSSNSAVIEATDGYGAPVGNHSIEILNMAKGSNLTGAKIENAGNPVSKSTKISDLTSFAEGEVKTISISLDGGTTTMDVSLDENDTIETLTDKLKGLDIEASISFDDNYDRFFISSKATGADVQIQLDSTDSALLDAIGFTAGNRLGSAGEDSLFTYNGVEFSSDKNEISVNGLKFNILADSGQSTISVSQDVEKIYEKVKEFVNKYNEVLKSLEDKYTADSARGYEPLTSEEKAAMTEKDIEAWEKKIKDSLFKRDDRVFNIRNSMRITISSNDGVDTSSFKYSSLSELGIVTGRWQESGKLHIEGDEDDSIYSTKKNKLKEAIENDPEKVEELLTALGDELYEKMGKMMKSTTNSSALTFYDDKQMSKDLIKYEKKIITMERKMARIEERYYKQFAAMEQAMQKSQATGAWLSQQLGAF